MSQSRSSHRSQIDRFTSRPPWPILSARLPDCMPVCGYAASQLHYCSSARYFAAVTRHLHPSVIYVKHSENSGTLQAAALTRQDLLQASVSRLKAATTRSLLQAEQPSQCVCEILKPPVQDYCSGHESSARPAVVSECAAAAVSQGCNRVCTSLTLALSQYLLGSILHSHQGPMPPAGSKVWTLRWYNTRSKT